MSILRTYNIQNPDSAATNIQLTANGGIVVAGIVTANRFEGDGSRLIGISAIGIATAGGTVGTGVTILDFRGSGISTVTVNSGIATINITGGSSTPDISPVMMGMIF